MFLYASHCPCSALYQHSANLYSAADRKLIKFLEGGKPILERYTPFKTHSSTGEIQSPRVVSGNLVWGTKMFKINLFKVASPTHHSHRSCKATSFSYTQDIPQHSIGPEGTTWCTQKPATCPSPKSGVSIRTLIYCRYKCTAGRAS